MQVDVNLVIKELSNQISKLSEERAMYKALNIQREQEIQALKAQLESTKEVAEDGVDS